LWSVLGKQSTDVAELWLRAADPTADVGPAGAVTVGSFVSKMKRLQGRYDHAKVIGEPVDVQANSL
jgi:hypothetical protein